MNLKKPTLIVLTVLMAVFLYSSITYAQQGCCSHHGGVCDDCCKQYPVCQNNSGDNYKNGFDSGIFLGAFGASLSCLFGLFILKKLLFKKHL